jgi:hypothetical protein
MYPTDDEASARAQAQYERTLEMVRGMPEVFHDLWAYAANRAAVKAADGTVYPVSELTEAMRDQTGQVWVTFGLAHAGEADLASFQLLAGPVAALVPRSRALGSITLRYDQIAAVMIDEDEPAEDDEEAA